MTEAAPRRRTGLAPEERFQVLIVRRLRDVLHPSVEFRAIEHGTAKAGTAMQRARAWQRLENKGVKAGTTDLHYWWSPRHYLTIELKHGSNKPTPEQTAFMLAIRAAGFIADVAWSAADVEAIMRLAGVPFTGRLSDIDARLAIEAPARGPARPAKPRAARASRKALDIARDSRRP